MVGKEGHLNQCLSTRPEGLDVCKGHSLPQEISLGQFVPLMAASGNHLSFTHVPLGGIQGSVFGSVLQVFGACVWFFECLREPE